MSDPSRRLLMAMRQLCQQLLLRTTSLLLLVLLLQSTMSLYSKVYPQLLRRPSRTSHALRSRKRKAPSAAFSHYSPRSWKNDSQMVYIYLPPWNLLWKGLSRMSMICAWKRLTKVTLQNRALRKHHPIHPRRSLVRVYYALLFLSTSMKPYLSISCTGSWQSVHAII